jgi:hydrogenase small subunit
MPRREFLQFCATVAASLGLPPGADAAVAEAVASKKRPSVIWLHFQECTGCTESMLRAEHPTLEKLILDVISLDYHETLFAAAGHQAEQARKTAMAENKGATCWSSKAPSRPATAASTARSAARRRSS